MQEEIKALHEKNTWDLLELHKVKGYTQLMGLRGKDSGR